ncbi:MAG: pantothenate kinase [Clostridia bacterium]|nr:pantothenate kinase [Clostridia bacterium]
MRTVIGIDVGGSTTKIVGFRENDSDSIQMIEPQFVHAADPITSVYGAFGRFTSQNGIGLNDIDCVMMTGVGSTFVQQPLYSLDCRAVSEFSSIGLGGLYLSGLNEAIIVSMGTGTALIHAKRDGKKTVTTYLGGTGVGGGTLVGLSRKIIGVDTIEHIEQLCEAGDIDKIDLRIKDISDKSLFPSVNHELTAANFGKLSDMATKEDIALGIANMVAETIAMMSIFVARGHGLRDIVLTGNLSSVKPVRKIIGGLSDAFDVNFIFPDNAQFGTVIGAALGALNE